MKLSSRLTLAMVGLVMVTAIAVGWTTYRNLEAVALPRALERVESHVRLLASDLAGHVRSARGYFGVPIGRGLAGDRACPACRRHRSDRRHQRTGLASAHGGALRGRAGLQASLSAVPDHRGRRARDRARRSF